MIRLSSAFNAGSLIKALACVCSMGFYSKFTFLKCDNIPISLKAIFATAVNSISMC